MATDIHPIILEYQRENHKYEEFRKRAERLLSDLINSTKIKIHSVTSRSKSVDGLDMKMVRKGYPYARLHEITDLVGIRIITLFEDDIDRIAEIIESEFLIDRPNCVDKRKMNESTFGYRSLHYVISLSEERILLPEYRAFDGLKAEVQIRSILQHSWAEIEHDLGYKGDIEIPGPAKRSFHRVAALLELADIEFSKLRQQLETIQKKIKEDLSSDPKAVRITYESIKAYIQNSGLVRDLEFNLKRLGIQFVPLEDFDSHLVHLVKLLKNHGIENISELEKSYIDHRNKIMSEARARIKSSPGVKYVQGISLMWLARMLENKFKMGDR